MNEFFTKLNEDQIKPVMDTEGAVLVIAGAGSGKTRVLTHRIVYLVTEKKINPSNILAITFTNKASNEMKERLSSMIENIGDMWISTIHSMCVRILRSNIDKIGYNSNFSIYTDTDKDRVIKRILDENSAYDEKFAKKLKWHIGNAKSLGLTIEEYQHKFDFENDIDRYCDFFKQYEKELKESNSLDFDDLLVKTTELFKWYKDVLAYYTNKFKYTHVDEFQDINAVQYTLIKQLCSGSGNIFAVGDDDQSIYGWRGAEVKNILNFPKDFSGARVYKLEQNYRSTKKILTLANGIIANNSVRNKKSLWTANDDGEEVETYLGEDENSEALFCATAIKSMMREKDYKASDIAVLMRINALSRAIEQEFTKYGIHYKIHGGFRFFERKEIKDLTSYLRILNNPLDNESIIRVINVPKRGIGGQTVNTLLKYADDNSLALFDAIMDIEDVELSSGAKNKIIQFKNLIVKLLQQKELNNLSEFIRILLNETGFANQFLEKGEENSSKLANINEYINSIEEFCKLNPNSSLSDYLNSITLSSDTDNINDDDNVSVATIHAVKGLEFKAVFIIGMDENIFPLAKENNSDEMEEERRLMYVAITRAKEKLYITRARSRFVYGARQYTVSSRFLKELEPILTNRPKRIDKLAPTNPMSSSFNSYNRKDKSNIAYNKYMPTKKTEVSKEYGLYGVGVKVSHIKFGEGTIIAKKGDGSNTIVDVAFKGVGVKSLSVQLAPMEIID